jgi:putative membrane protein
MRYLILYLKGMLMGAADIVPGVSGGTIALITGIYEELLHSINAVSWKNLKLLQERGIRSVWKELNGSFLITVFGGIITSILILSRLLEWLILNEPIGLWSFFFGLLIASIVYLYKTDLKVNLTSLFYLCLGTIISFSVTQLGVIQNEVSLWYLFLSGFIGISAMILPGLSGAYILFLMGVYQIILSNVRQAQDLFFDFNMEKFIEMAEILGVFILGIILGIKIFSKVLTWLLERYPQKILAVLIGLMIGSLHKVWPWQNKIFNNSFSEIKKTVAVLPQDFLGDSPQILKAFILMFLGFVVLFITERSKTLFKNEI